MVGCGLSLIVKVSGGQPCSSSGDVALGIQVINHKRMMGGLTREQQKRRMFLVCHSHCPIAVSNMAVGWCSTDVLHHHIHLMGTHSCADVALTYCCQPCWGLPWLSQAVGDGFLWWQQDMVVAWQSWKLWWWLRERKWVGCFQMWDVSQMRDQQLPNDSASAQKCPNVDYELKTQPIKVFYSPLELISWVEHSYIKFPVKY